MRIRSVVGGALVAVGLLAAGTVAASANVVWCLSDPPMQVNTAAGTNLMVNTTVYLPPNAVHLQSKITEQVSSAPDGVGGTLITVRVGIPAGVSTAKVVSSDNRFSVTATGYGTGGSTVTLYLDVPAN